MIDQRGLGLAPDVDSWNARLTQAASRIDALLGDCEEEFLSTGTRLTGIHERSSAIVEAGRDTAGAFAGAEVETARNGLTRLVGRMQTYFSTVGGQLSRAEAAPAEILQHLHEVDLAMECFEKLVRMLRILGITTKIESARMVQGEGGFDSLSASVHDLAVRIQQRLEAISEQKDVLGSNLQQAMRALRSLSNHQQSSAQSALAKTHSSLAYLVEAHRKGSDATRAVAEGSAAVARNVGEIVVSMQFHDITRQEMEHVSEGLRRLVSELNGGRLPETTEMADAVDLQRAQLSASTARLVTAVRQLMENLRGVASNTGSLYSEIHGILGVLDQAGHSFLSGIESSMAPVLDLLSENAAAARGLARTMQGVADTATAMSRFATEIELIGADIHLIALNASIKAAHTGDDGATLGVLAEEIARLSADTRVRTQEVAGPLRGMVEAAALIRREFEVSGHEANSSEDVAEYAQAMQGWLVELRRVNEELAGRLRGMAQEVTLLASDVEASVTGLTLHDRVAQAAAEIGADLTELVIQAGGRTQGRESASQGELLSWFADGYTTDGERHIHDSIAHCAGEILLPARQPAEPGWSAGGSDLGDNVELF